MTKKIDETECVWVIPDYKTSSKENTLVCYVHNHRRVFVANSIKEEPIAR